MDKQLSSNAPSNAKATHVFPPLPRDDKRDSMPEYYVRRLGTMPNVQADTMVQFAPHQYVNNAHFALTTTRPRGPAED